MNYVLTPEQMRAADSDGIRLCGIPAQQLMENAAKASVEVLQTLGLSATARVLVACGCGNNGGDGFAIARLLHTRSSVRVVWIGDSDNMSDETRRNYERTIEMGIPCQHIETDEDVAQAALRETDLIVDALIGIGGSEHLRGVAIPLLQDLNAVRAVRVAIDVPTGLNALTGVAHAECFRADHTITMAAMKTGHYLLQGLDVCGVLHVVRIGLPKELLLVHSNIQCLEDEDVRRLIPIRERRSSKFDYGRVCIVAGSRDMPGAAALCANAAIRSGAGLVELCTTHFHSSVLPEVLQTHLQANAQGGIAFSECERVRKACSRAQVIVLGPGVGTSSETIDLLRAIVDEFSTTGTKKIVVDGDGLRAIDARKVYGPSLTLTPHSKEFAHLISRLDSVTTPQQFATATMSCVVLKGVPVSINLHDAEFWNCNGNPGMATAGSGDVLAGVIAAMLCRIPEAVSFHAVAAGVYVHATAGDVAAESTSMESMSASTILDCIPAAFHRILGAGR